MEELLIGALADGDHDQMLELARDLLEAWPLQKIRNRHEWRILAALSQVGFDNHMMGIAADEIARKVAITARLSYYQTKTEYDFICRTVAMSVIEEPSIDEVKRCLANEEPISHYAASRLGLSAYRHRRVDILKLCIARSSKQNAKNVRLADPAIELAVLQSCYDILMNRDPKLDKIIDLYRATRPENRPRYLASLSILIDPEDLLYA